MNSDPKSQPSTPGRFPGIYRGVVVDRKDPDLQLRLKVSCHTVFGELAKKDLPWAYPALGSWKDGGVGHVPPEGAPVYVMFEEGEPEHPVWFPGSPGNKNSPSPTPDHAHQGKDPDNYYLTTPRGSTIQVDDRSGSEKVLIRLPEGDYLVMEASGDADFRTENSTKIRAPVKVEITSRRRVEIKAQTASLYGSNQVDVHGGNVNIKGDSAVNIDGSSVNINGGASRPDTGGTTTDTDMNSNQDGS